MAHLMHHYPHPYYGCTNTDFENWKRATEEQLAGIKRDIEHQIRDRDYHSELTFQQSRPTNLVECYSLLNPIRVDSHGNRWLNTYFDLKGYKPEEISVTLNAKEHCVIIEAGHEATDDKEHYVKRHYLRKLFIPRDFKIDTEHMQLKSCLTNEGILCVESTAPLVPIGGLFRDHVLPHVMPIDVKVE